MNIALETPEQSEVARLIEDLDAFQRPLYPPESHHGIDIAALSQPNVLFAVAPNKHAAAVGCGAIVLQTEFGEIKRMFVRPENRGEGIARQLLAFLEGEAVANGCTRLVLETGIRQPEALALYAQAGYVRRGPFGTYAHDPLSVFMQKDME